MKRDLTGRCAELITMIGEPDFGQRFLRCLDGALGVDQCTVFLISDEGAEPVVAETRTDRFRQLVRDLSHAYVRGDHKRDPMRARIGEMQSGAGEIVTLNPCDLRDSEYRAQFYDRPNIRQELALISRFGGKGFYVALYRERSSMDFTLEDADFLGSFMSPAVEALKKHVEIIGRNAPSPRPRPQAERVWAVEEHVRKAMLDDGHGLTPREAAVCAGIVLGYTVFGISSKLGITVNTVATHRKRAYAKLRISSQNELFARYFERVNRFQTSI